MCDPSLSPLGEMCDLAEGGDAAPAASVVDMDTSGIRACLSEVPLLFSAESPVSFIDLGARKL